MHDVSGISGAAPAWAAIMDALHPTGGESDPALQAPKPAAGLLRLDIQAPGEAPRREWFIPGSEPLAEPWQAARPVSEILHPANGMILAIDPDIPRERQQLHFRARNPPAGATWQLDGVTMTGEAWPLTRGKHRLSLIDTGGAAIDQIEFEVR